MTLWLSSYAEGRKCLVMANSWAISDRLTSSQSHWGALFLSSMAALKTLCEAFFFSRPENSAWKPVGRVSHCLGQPVLPLNYSLWHYIHRVMEVEAKYRPTIYRISIFLAYMKPCLYCYYWHIRLHCCVTWRRSSNVWKKTVVCELVSDSIKNITLSELY